jgi:CRP-like cAMP-binding protein
MKDFLSRCQLFEELGPSYVSRVAMLAEQRTLAAGERLFELGAEAAHVYVVVEGTVELCLPLSIHGAIKEVVVESQGPGTTIGWSAFVKPYRFRLAARAAGPVVVAVFDRQALLRLIELDAVFGRVLLTRIAETIGRRLLTVQALWARELQRSVDDGLQASHEHPRDAHMRD